MRGYRPQREWYIPQGATKVACKGADAVAYLYSNPQGRPAAVMFAGKAQKPSARYYYMSEKKREEAVKRFFDGCRAHAARVAKEKAQRAAWVNDYKVGDILDTCWGYEQTNREFFEVVAVRGKTLVLRELAQETVETAWAQGKCVPLPGVYIGEPIRRRAGQYGVKIDDVRRATRSRTTDIGGVKVVDPVGWTAYH